MFIKADALVCACFYRFEFASLLFLQPSF